MNNFTKEQEIIIKGRLNGLTYAEIIKDLPGMRENKAKLIFHYAAKSKDFMRYKERKTK